LKSAQEMVQLFNGCPEAIANTSRIAERCTFDLTRDLNYRFPDYNPPLGYTPASYLRKL
jgi:error-prone DNA polymerase